MSILEKLTQKQASQIVRRLMECIPYNINIMDKDGVIIASGKRSRIGTLHEDMKRAIDSKQIVLVREDSLFSKKGSNEPISFEGEIVGGVGITGDPDEVAPFAKLVRTVAQMLLEELKSYKTIKLAEQSKKDFLAQLIRQHGQYSESLIRQGLAFYHLDLSTAKRVVFALTRDALDYPSKEIFSFESGFLVFLEGQDELTTVTAGQAQVFVSPLTADFYVEIAHAWQTSLLSQFLKITDKVVEIQDLDFLRQFFAARFDLDEDRLKTLEGLYDDSYETLITFFNHDLSIGTTAEQLHIHRNTLHYRLDKIFRLSGLNPLVVQDLMILIYYFASIFMTRQKRSQV